MTTSDDLSLLVPQPARYVLTTTFEDLPVYRLLLIASLLCPAGIAHAGGMTAPAAEPVTATAPATERRGLVFTLRGGVATTPDYFGSDENVLGPDFAFSLNRLTLGPLEFGGTEQAEPKNLGIRGSFRYVNERSVQDNPELTGLDDVDATYEFGLGLGYTIANFEAFADLRYGFVGSESFVGELGADVLVHPSDRLTLSAGPRVLLGDDKYARTYFGVTESEAAASDGRFTAYDAAGGLVSAGLEFGARYDVNEDWGVVGAVTYDRLMGDAADSPIVEQGDRDQYGLRIGVTRRITLDF